MTWHLSLLPIPATLRAPVAVDDMPLLIVVPSPLGERGDFVPFELTAASNGWMVVELGPSADVGSVVDTISDLQSGAIDAAFDGRISRSRVALLLGGMWPESSRADDDLAALGLPWIQIGGETGIEITAYRQHVAVFYPDAEIPWQAYTTRARMVIPPYLLVGGSDVTPSDLAALELRVATTVLADGTSMAPVFSGASVDQSTLTAGLSGATVRQLPVARQ
jgi:hypothetical protein